MLVFFHQTAKFPALVAAFLDSVLQAIIDPCAERQDLLPALPPAPPAPRPPPPPFLPTSHTKFPFFTNKIEDTVNQHVYTYQTHKRI